MQAAVLLLSLPAWAGKDVTKYVPVGVDAPAGPGRTERLDVMVPATGEHAISTPADIFKHVGRVWDTVVEKHQAGLVDPKQMHLASAALMPQEAWHHYNAAQHGVVDSARFLIAFSMVPAVQSGGSALHIAAAMGAVDRVRSLIADGADVDEEKATDGTTPLHQAATMCHAEVARVLLDKGANVEARGNSGATALQMAAAMGCDAVTTALLESGADPDFKHKFAGTTALHFAAEMGRTSTIRLLCSKGADANAEKSTGGTPLHTAADANQSAAVETLVTDCGVKTNKLLMGDTMPLYLAAQRGFTDVCSVLLDHGAHIDFAMPRGKFRMALERPGGGGDPTAFYDEKNTEVGNGATALHAAVENGHPDTVKLLLARGAKQLTSMEGASPLVIALQYRHPAIALVLMEDCARAKVNDKVPIDGSSPLFVAAGYNYRDVVRRLLECGADPNVRNKHGATPLSHALRYGLRGIAGDLLAAGADVSATMDGEVSMMEAAIDGGHESAVATLLQRDPEALHRKGRGGRSPLHAAAERGKHRIAAALLKLGADAHQKTPDTKETPLALAARAGSEDLVKDLIARGADVNVAAGRSLHWATPLFVAAQSGFTGVCRALLEAGAKVDAALHGLHVTPLIAAAERGHFNVVELLLLSGASATFKDKRGFTALHTAAQSDSRHAAGVAGLLLDQGAQVDARDARRATPLILAALADRNHEVLRKLVASGADTAAADAVGRTAVHAAALGHRHDAPQLTRFLLQSGANADAADVNGTHPLHLAAFHGKADVAAELLKGGAAVDARRADGSTPLLAAVAKGHADLAAMLVKHGASASAPSKDGTSPLGVARAARDFKLLRAIGAGADEERPASARLFAAADADGDGALSRGELRRGLRSNGDLAAFLGLPQEISGADGSKDAMERVFQTLDKDSDRSVTAEELSRWQQPPAASESNEQGSKQAPKASECLPSQRCDDEEAELDD